MQTLLTIIQQSIKIWAIFHYRPLFSFIPKTETGESISTNKFNKSPAFRNHISELRKTENVMILSETDIALFPGYFPFLIIIFPDNGVRSGPSKPDVHSS